jgi:putative flavoprotein involved in K+ transport
MSSFTPPLNHQVAHGNGPEAFNVIIVGAGPAGIGVAMALRECGIENFLILDARGAGASFAAWPPTMRMITPSFFSNPFNLPDLNSVDPRTSPADFTRNQHPDGKGYARYLQSIVEEFKLPVRSGVKVSGLRRDEQGFALESSAGSFQADMVVWAAGQFFYPKTHDFSGAEHCLHSSEIRDWNAIDGQEITIIGGYESGFDTLINLAESGHDVRLLSRGEPWATDSADPSRSLSPRTIERFRSLRDCPSAGRVDLVKTADIKRIEKQESWWVLYDHDDIPMVCHSQPILANGYDGSLALIAGHFQIENGHPIFSEDCDESTLTPGLFYSGPELRHRDSLFCFIYKFRSRFGLIAREIATRLGIEDADGLLRKYRETGFMNPDLDCCTSCKCAIAPEEESAPAVSNYREKAILALEKI